jgi:hypothetical protein
MFLTASPVIWIVLFFQTTPTIFNIQCGKRRRNRRGWRRGWKGGADS